MDSLYRRGITDLDNIPEEPYLRVLRTFPALLDVSAFDVSVALIAEAAAASAYGFASPHFCNIVAERWLAAWQAAHPIAA